MQRLAGKVCCQRKRTGLGLGLAAWGSAIAAILRVADQGMSQMGEVDPDLVGAPGFQPAFDQRSEGAFGGAEFFQHRITCRRPLAAGAQHRHALAVEWAAPDLAFDQAGGVTRRSPYDGVIGALDGVIGELLGQARHGPFGLGRHQQARGVLVQPVDDAGARFAADGQHLGAAMGDQCIDQGAVGIAGGGMHHQPRRFVDHDQFLVLIDHRQGNVLALRNGGRGGRHLQREGIARFDPVVGVFYRPAAQRHRAAFQQLLEPRAAEIGQCRGQETVQPPACMAFIGHRFAPIA